MRSVELLGHKLMVDMYSINLPYIFALPPLSSHYRHLRIQLVSLSPAVIILNLESGYINIIKNPDAYWLQIHVGNVCIHDNGHSFRRQLVKEADWWPVNVRKHVHATCFAHGWSTHPGFPEILKRIFFSMDSYVVFGFVGTDRGELEIGNQ